LALLVVGFFGFLFGFTGVEAYHGQHHLAEELGGCTSASAPGACAAGLDALNGRVPAEGQPAAILVIRTLGLRQIVVEGTSSIDLENGPGLLVGSAPPGTGGDTVIAGRRSTYGAPFAHLPELRPGTTIGVTGALGTFNYSVTAVRTVLPGSPLPASPTSQGRLTLVTSNEPFSPSGLVVVTARLVSKPLASVPLQAAAVPPATFGLAGDGSALAPAILWGEAIIGVLILAWVLARRSRQHWMIYAMAAPVVIALALLCYGNVAALLAATL
jgi:sortase A